MDRERYFTLLETYGKDLLAMIKKMVKVYGLSQMVKDVMKNFRMEKKLIVISNENLYLILQNILKISWILKKIL